MTGLSPLPRYVPGRPCRCDRCGSRSWIVGGTTAQCAGCGSALMIAGNVNAEIDELGLTLNKRPTEIEEVMSELGLDPVQAYRHVKSRRILRSRFSARALTVSAPPAGAGKP